MNCEEFTLLLDTPETERTQQQRQEMETHMKACPACAMAFAIQHEMRGMDLEESVPASFSASWREKIRREEKMKMNRQHFSWKKALAAAAAVVFVAGGTWLSYANGWGLESGKKAAPQSMTNRVAEDEAYGSDAAAGNYLMRSSAKSTEGAMLDYGAQTQAEKVIR